MIRANIYQIDISKYRDDINAEGWEVGNRIPAVKAYLDTTTFGPDRYQPDMAACYTLAGDAEGETLEDIFAIGNGAKEGRYQAAAGKLRSLSVGDIVEDEDSGEVWMVAPFGFEPVAFDSRDAIRPELG